MSTHDTKQGKNKDDDDLEETCFLEGDRVGRYLIIDKLGQGGMGVVYRAYDTKLEREVALKCLDARSMTSVAQGRLLREARAMAQLSHPNVVTVYDVEEVQNQLVFSMEYVKGEDLEAWVRAESLPWRAVLTLFLEAEYLQKRALVIWKNTFGPNHPNVADLLNNLAMVYHSQGKNVEAEELHKKALTIKVEALGQDHPIVAVSLNNLALACQSQGKYGDAEGLYKRALAIQEKALSPDHPDVAWPLVGLAETHEKLHRFAEALPLLERARAIREKAAVAPKDRATSAFALARVLRVTGKGSARARTLAQEALGLFHAEGPGAEKDRQEVERWIKEHR